MRDYERPNTSSRVGWWVAGVAGFVLLAWGLGWFDIGGPNTGSLPKDPIAGDFEDLNAVPFEGLPEQSEPGVEAEPVVVAALPADAANTWGPPLPPEEQPHVPPSMPGEPPVYDPTIAEIPNAIPPEFTDSAPAPSETNPGPEPAADSSVTLIGAEAPNPGEAAPLLDLNQIDELIRDGRTADAHAALSRIWIEHPRSHPTIARRIDATARTIFFDPEPHFVAAYTVQSGDTLREIGREYGVPWEYIVRLNRVDPRRIQPGQELKVVKGPFHAHVDLSEFTLLVHTNGLYVKQYRIGVGREGGTPVGRFTIKDKVTNPSYTDPEGRVIAGDDPHNPIGERWMSLGRGYGIHGTIAPDSIGRAESAGCVRMLNDDVAEVFDLLGIGSEVVIVP